MEQNPIGIDRGMIRQKKADGASGAYLYKVESYAREGVLSRWMEPLSASVHEYRGEPPVEDKTEYSVGDPVYFFMFPDGRGLVLGRMRMDL